MYRFEDQLKKEETIKASLEFEIKVLTQKHDQFMIESNKLVDQLNQADELVDLVDQSDDHPPEVYEQLPTLLAIQHLLRDNLISSQEQHLPVLEQLNDLKRCKT